MASWNFDACETCDGSGKINGRKCAFCEGTGFWEFVAEDNHLALQALRGGDPANENIKALCDRRLKQVTPDNLGIVLALLEVEDFDFDALQQSGAERWGWAWLHANRFAIELVKLCGGIPTQHGLACSKLAWKWLSEENQKKVDAPIDNPNPVAL
jgi:hypothetical protein